MSLKNRKVEANSTKTGTGTTTDGVEDEESLKTGAVISQLSEAVQAQVDDLLTDGVVTTGEVVGGILLTGDQLFRVEELTVGTGTDLVDHGGLQVDEDGTGDVLTGTGLGEEGVEGIVTTADGLVGRHLPIWGEGGFSVGIEKSNSRIWICKNLSKSPNATWTEILK